jgi:hypothetical protein
LILASSTRLSSRTHATSRRNLKKVFLQPYHSRLDRYPDDDQSSAAYASELLVFGVKKRFEVIRHDADAMHVLLHSKDEA